MTQSHPVWSLWPHVQDVQPSLGPSPPLCSPQTLSLMGAVCRARRRGRPGLKLQDKVRWGVPPRAGVIVSSDWSVNSPVSGCLLVSSFTDTPMVGEGEGKLPHGVWGRGIKKKAAQRGGLGTYLCHQVSGLSHPNANSASLQGNPPQTHMSLPGERGTSSSLTIRLHTHAPSYTPLPFS